MRAHELKPRRHALGVASLFALAVGPMVAPPPLVAQVVRGVVSDVESRTPVAGAMVLLLGADDRAHVRVLTAEDGGFILSAPVAGRYRLRVDRIGYASVVSDPFDVPAGPAVVHDMTTGIEPVALEGIDVEGARRCEVRPAEGLATARVWEEARKALAAAAWTAERGMYRFAWRRFVRELAPDGRRVLEERRTLGRGFTAQPFVAAPAERLAEEGFVGEEGGDNIYYAPDANVLLSDAFLDTHCLALDDERTDEGLIGLRFEPVRRRSVPEVEGVVWLERAGARLRSVEYGYVNLGRQLDAPDANGEIRFQELPNGTWIVQAWRIRMPRVQEERRAGDRFGSGTRYVVLGYRDEGGEVRTITTATGGVVRDARGGGAISGVVHDSLGGPAAGAHVRLAGTDREARSDAGGAFTITDVAPGRWRVGASVPALDAAGHTGTWREGEVGDTPVTNVLLELPSVGDAVLAGCDVPPGEEEGALFGEVVDETGQPVSGAAVRALWTEVRRSGIPNAFRLNDRGLGVDTDARGAYVLCGVPTTLPVSVTAAIGARSSAKVEARFGESDRVASVRLVLLRDLSGREAVEARPSSDAPRGEESAAAPGTDAEGRWLAEKGFPLRREEALLHLTGGEVRHRRFAAIARILEELPRVEVRSFASGAHVLLLHEAADWRRDDPEASWCTLDLYLNGNLARQGSPDPRLTPDRLLDLRIRALSGIEVFDAAEAPVVPPGGCGAVLLWFHDMPEVDVDFEGRLSGRIVAGPDDTPAGDVLVTLEPGGHAFRTDSRGRFDFGRLPPSRYTLETTVLGWGSWTSEVLLRAGDDQDRTIRVEVRRDGA